MSVRLEEQIRRYTEAADFMAAPIEELMPAAMASKLDIEPNQSVGISVSLRPPQRPPRLPGWAYGLAAALAGLILAIPVWLLLSNPVDDVADTTHPATTVPLPPVESAGPFLRAESEGVVTGVGWPPSSSITFAVNALEGDESFSSDSAGRFNLRLASIGLRFEPGDTLSATDGLATRQILIPALTVDTFDPNLGVASGMTSLPDGTRVELRIPAPGDGAYLQLPATVQAGTWSFTFEPMSPEQASAESWVSVRSGEGLYEVRLEP